MTNTEDTRPGFLQRIAAGNRKSMLLVGAGVLTVVVLIVGYAVAVNSPRNIAISVNVEDVYGGAFDESCIPVEDARSLNLGELKVSLKGKNIPSTSAGVSAISRGPGLCEITGEYSLLPNEDYSVTYSNKNLGNVLPNEVKNGVQTFTYSLEFTMPLSVDVDLYAIYESCSGTTNNYHCRYVGSRDLQSCDYVGTDLVGCNYSNLYTSNWPIYTENSSDFCQGQNSLSFINPESQVTITGLTNGQSMSMKLGKGKRSLVSVESRALDCSMNVNFANFPYDELGYKLNVAGDFQSDYYTTDLRVNGWKLGMWYGPKP